MENRGLWISAETRLYCMRSHHEALRLQLGNLGIQVRNTLLQVLPRSAELGLGLRSLVDNGNLLDLKLRLLRGNESTLQTHQLRLTSLATEPGTTLHGRDRSSGVREQIVLEQIRLTRHAEGDRLHIGAANLEAAGDLANGDVASSLRAESHAELRHVALVLRDEMDERLVIHQLVVTNVAVSLAGKEQQLGVVVVERHDDSRGSIDGLAHDLGAQVTRIVDAHLTVAGASESDGQDLSGVTREDGTASLDANVGRTSVKDGGISGTRVNEAEVLVLGGREHLATVAVPVHGLDHLSVSADGDVGRSSLDVPDLHSVVGRRGRHHVVRGRVEANGSNLALVANKALHGVGQVVAAKTSIGNGPDTAVAILGHGTNDVIVERVEVNVQDSTLVARDQSKVGRVLSTGLIREHGERASTTGVPDQSNEAAVCGALVAVPGALGRLHVVVERLLLGGLTKDVTELGRTDNSRHCDKTYVLASPKCRTPM